MDSQGQLSRLKSWMRCWQNKVSTLLKCSILQLMLPYWKKELLVIGSTLLVAGLTIPNLLLQRFLELIMSLITTPKRASFMHLHAEKPPTEVTDEIQKALS
ncbi:unnamed protein product [Musa textilis]